MSASARKTQEKKSQENRIYKVGISGSYGGLNMGDEAILQSIINGLRRSLPVEITVFSRNPEDTLSRHGVERAVPAREMTRNEITPEIKRLDLLVLGGGGILFDAEAAIYLRDVLLAQEMEIPTMTYAISAGPLKERSVQTMVREALKNMKVVTVRERRAQRILEDIGVEREIIVTADPAVLMESEPVTEEMLLREHIPIGGGRRIVGMSVREPGVAAPELDEKFYHALLANAADYMVDRYNADIILMPMERRMLDLQHSHAVVSKMLRPQRATVIKGNYTSGQLLSLMKHFDFAVGMRLHFLIFAAVQGIPFVGLPYSEKVLGFLHDLEIQMPPIQLVNAGRLIAHIDYFWDHRGTFNNKIARLLPKIQERARSTNQITVDLLKGSLAKSAQKRIYRKEHKTGGDANACAHTSQSIC